MPVEALDTLVCLVVEFAVHCLPFCINHLEGVRPIAVHEPVAVRRSSVGEKEGNLEMISLQLMLPCQYNVLEISTHLVCGHGHKRNEVPKHIGVLQVGHRVSLLCVNKVWEEDRIP